MWNSLWVYLIDEGFEIIQWAKCGESIISALPTVLWAIGAAALAHKIISATFRRSLFRRVPLWEIILQNLLFFWLIIYSVHFWTLLVRIVKTLVEYCYYEDRITDDDLRSQRIMEQWMIWMCSAVPLLVYIQSRPRPEPPPLMIWITTNPWQRREMGPYGYYLNRPLSSLQSSTNLTIKQQALNMRRAFSDSKIMTKEPVKKKRNSKSV